MLHRPRHPRSARDGGPRVIGGSVVDDDQSIQPAILVCQSLERDREGGRPPERDEHTEQVTRRNGHRTTSIRGEAARSRADEPLIPVPTTTAIAMGTAGKCRM